jgi:hypothetical protein
MKATPHGPHTIIIVQDHAEMATALAAQAALYAFKWADGAKLQAALPALRAAGITTLLSKADSLIQEDKALLAEAVTSQQESKLMRAVAQAARSMLPDGPEIQPAKQMIRAIQILDEAMGDSQFVCFSCA